MYLTVCHEQRYLTYSVLLQGIEPEPRGIISLYRFNIRKDFNCSCSKYYRCLERKWSSHLQKCLSRTSGQDGGIGRCTLPPNTTKIGTTKKLKTINNQNCLNIELYGSLTTKEWKKKHSSRLVGGVETGSWGGGDSLQGGSWRTRWSHIYMRINLEEQLGSEIDCTTQSSSAGK